MEETKSRGDAFLEMLIRDYEVEAAKALAEIDYIKRLYKQHLYTHTGTNGLRSQFQWESRNYCDAKCEADRLKGKRDDSVRCD